jgi:HlyD family secretion protein
VDTQTRAALVYVDLLPGTPEAIKAGMFAAGEMVLGDSAATTVPQQAVVNRDGFTYLFVLAEPKGSDAAGTARVQRLKVQAGRRVGDRVEIASGLPAGAAPRVVVQGAGFLNDGDVVKVVAGPTTEGVKK